MANELMPGRSRAPDFAHWQSPETRVRWERGLAIIAGMIGIVVTFFVLLVSLPISAGKPEVRPAGPAGAPTATPPLSAAAPTATPQVAATPKLSAIAPEASNVRRQPSLSGQIVTILRQGQRVDVVGRTPDSQWLQILLPERPAEKLWVSADRLDVTGDPRTLPEVRE